VQDYAERVLFSIIQETLNYPNVTSPTATNCLQPLPTVALVQDYAERVLPSIIQETLKSVVAQYNASQLLTMREVGVGFGGWVGGTGGGRKGGGRGREWWRSTRPASC
jgi:hypothetical protein